MEVFKKLVPDLTQLQDFIYDIKRFEAFLIRVEQVPQGQYLITYVHHSELK